MTCNLFLLKLLPYQQDRSVLDPFSYPATLFEIKTIPASNNIFSNSLRPAIKNDSIFLLFFIGPGIFNLAATTVIDGLVFNNWFCIFTRSSLFLKRQECLGIHRDQK